MNEQATRHDAVNIVLLGPPGAGKSTIAEALAAQYPLAVIATGQRLRAEVQAHSTLGREVAPYLERGELAPDSLMDRILRASIEALDTAQGFLIDGYPRTYRQALGLSGLLADFGRTLHAAIVLEIEDEEVVRRLSGRQMCEGVGEPFPVHVDDLASIMRCRERGGRLVQRDDDRPEVVRQRLAIYQQQTQPVVAYYAETGLLRRIDAAGAPAQVARQALMALQEGARR